jgi:hypothetical protein
LTDDTATTKRQNNRFNMNEHSPGDLSNKTTLTTYTENNFGNELNNKQFIQARLIKTNIDDGNLHRSSPSPTKQSTPNLNIIPKNNQRQINPHSFKSSYDQLMNTTLTTDTDDDPDANSRRLLTNKVNSSQIIAPTSKRKATNNSFIPQSFNPIEIERSQNNSNISTFTNGSILSKSTLNMTNITPLNGSLANSSQIINQPQLQQQQQQPNAQFSSSEYENLSNNTLNDILTNYPNHSTANSSKQTTKSTNNLLQIAKPRSNNHSSNNSNIINTAQQPPNLPPPPVPQLKANNFNYNQQLNTDDSDSVASCQLITSSTLLSNRNIVKNAQNVNTNKFTPQSILKQQQTDFTPNNSHRNQKHYDTDSESGMSCQLITSSNLLLNRDMVKDAKQISNKEPMFNSNFPPQLTSQFIRAPLQQPTDTDSDSVMSCQLITSSSLLLNRNLVREAQNIVESPSQKRQPLQQNTKALPPLNPRHFLTTQPKTNESTTQTHAISNEINQDSDASKPPPMETAI